MKTESSPSVLMESASPTTSIAVAYGDGIGPEIMEATLRVLEAAGCGLQPERVELGESVYRRGVSSGVDPEAWDVIRRTGVLLKAPISTPQGGGFKSVNVTLRKSFGFFANVRPCVAYAPYVATKHPRMDLVIVRENEEDLYAGIEHRQTDEVMQCLKLITRPGCERIVRYAFEYARQNRRSKVTCMTKDNIMKLTDGLFHKVFNEVAAEYKDIASEHLIVDIGTARVADTPERFDVIVVPNLYGDILSDVAAQLAGSVGLAGSANIGDYGAMFEAIHGSAPDIAGKDKANPSGLLMAAVMMLVHLGKTREAALIKNAWLATLEAGVHTADIRGQATAQTVGTGAFADAIIAHLGQTPRHFKAADFAGAAPKSFAPIRYERKQHHKEMVGVDLFIHYGGETSAIAALLSEAATRSLALTMVTNRGVKVWPNGHPETFTTDHWRCRFQRTGFDPVTHADILELMTSVVDRGLDIIKTENLCNFDGQPGFAAGQGQ